MPHSMRTIRTIQTVRTLLLAMACVGLLNVRSLAQHKTPPKAPAPAPNVSKQIATQYPDILEAYKEIEKGYAYKKPEPIIAVWSPNMKTYAAKVEALKKQFPGNRVPSGHVSPTMYYYPKTVTANATGSQVTISGLYYGIEPSTATGQSKGAAHGGKFTHVWSRESGSSAWLLLQEELQEEKTGYEEVAKLANFALEVEQYAGLLNADLAVQAAKKRPLAKASSLGFAVISDTDADLSNSFSALNIEEGRAHEGTDGVFDGEVAEVKETEDKKALLLLFSEETPSIVVYVLKKNVPRFPKLAPLAARHVLIKGFFQLQEGYPLVELTLPTQIKVVSNEAPKKPASEKAPAKK